MSRSYAHRMIESAAVVKMLPIGNKPATESQARPLAKLPGEEQAEAAAQNGGRSTGEGAPLTRPPAHAASHAPPPPRLSCHRRPTPPALRRAPAPFVRRGRTSGGGRRAPHTATEPARYARRRSWDAERGQRAAIGEAATEPGSAVSSSSLPPSDPPSHHHLSICGRPAGGKGGGGHRAGGLLCLQFPRPSGPRLDSVALSTPSESASRTALKGSRSVLPARSPDARSPLAGDGSAVAGCPPAVARTVSLAGFRPYTPRDLDAPPIAEDPRLAPRVRGSSRRGLGSTPMRTPTARPPPPAPSSASGIHLANGPQTPRRANGPRHPASFECMADSCASAYGARF